MEDKIIEVLEKYEVSNWDMKQMTVELLNLLDVSVSFNNEELKVIKTDVKHIVDKVVLNEKDEFIRFKILDKLNER